MASYSVPTGNIVAMGDGRYYAAFQNPDGSMTNWFSNWGTSYSGRGFVSPPADVWNQLAQKANDGVLAGLVQQLKWQETQVKAPVVTTQSLAVGVVPSNPYSTAGLMTGPTYENCNPLDSACVARNQVKSDAFGVAQAQENALANYNQCVSNAQNANGPEQFAQVMANCNGQYGGQSPTPGVAPPVATFTPSGYVTLLNPVVTQSSQTTGGSVNTGVQTVSTGTTNTNQTTNPVVTDNVTQTVFGLFGDTSPVLFGVVNEYTALGIAAVLAFMFMYKSGGK